MAEQLPIKIPCRHCNGTGMVDCQCEDHQLVLVKDHPRNVTYYRGICGSAGFSVKKCRDCGCVWTIDWQYDDGTGSDDKPTNYGPGDPFVLVPKL